jgi:hypothetical protein
MLITAAEYKDVLNTYFIVDCAIRDRNVFGFALDRVFTDKEVEEEERNNWDRAMRPKRLAVFYRDDPEGERLGAENLGNWGPLRLGAMAFPKSQFLMYESDKGRVYVIGSGEDAFEKPLSNRTNPDCPMTAGVDRIKTFNGKAFLAGGCRGFAERLGPDSYKSHKQLVHPIPEDDPAHLEDGFEDFDMFAEDDIYAAGGKGDAWHFNGKTWRQLSLPTNAWLNTVCCGGDGMVYISGYEGLTFMGRGDKWKQIHGGGVYLGWRDMVWFEDRAWATSDNGLWTIKDGRVEFQNHELPPEISVCSGNLYVADGVMLMAGLGGACFRENGKWHSIFTSGQMGKLLLDEAK